MLNLEDFLPPNTEPPTKDYLRYSRPARRYCSQEYDISESKLDMLVYLKPYRYFDAEDVTRFGQLLSWNDGNVGQLLRAGFIQEFRKAVRNRHRAVYELSHRGKTIVSTLYRIMETGEFPNNEKCKHNLKTNQKGSDKRFSRFCDKENQFRKDEAIKKGKR